MYISNDHKVLKYGLTWKVHVHQTFNLEKWLIFEKAIILCAKKFVVHFSDGAENENILIFKNVNMTFTKKMLISSTKKALAVRF